MNSNTGSVWRNPDYGFDPHMFGHGLGGLLGGLFGDSGAPYERAMDEYRRYGNMAREVNQPYLNAGSQALGHFQDWLGRQKNPDEFVNSLMSNYQQSPYNNYLQN